MDFVCRELVAERRIMDQQVAEAAVEGELQLLKAAERVARGEDLVTTLTLRPLLLLYLTLMECVAQ